MSNLFFFIIVGAVILIAFIAIIVALVLMGKNSKTQKNSPELMVQATVLGTYANEQSAYSVDSSNSNTNSTYYADFLLADNTKMRFKIKKKMFLELHDHDQGTLVYKGNKLIKFER